MQIVNSTVIRYALSFVFLGAAVRTFAQDRPPATPSPTPAAAPETTMIHPRIPAWTSDARWYYVKVPRFRNGDPANDPDGVAPWTTAWPPLEADETAPKDATGLVAMPHARRYGGDLRGVLQALPYLDNLGVNAICLSPVFHGGSELKLSQIDLRHVDDAVGVKGGFGLTSKEGATPESWVWTPSDGLLRELIHSAHERGMRVVVSGIFSAVMTSNSPPSELESYYLSATRRWMDPDGDGNPLDGVDGWLASIEEGPMKPLDGKFKAFWHRWRESVAKINPNAVVISSGTLALGQLSDGPFDIALHSAMASPVVELFGVAPNSRRQAKTLFGSVNNSATLAPGASMLSNIAMLSGGSQHARLLTALAATEPLRVARQLSPGPVPDAAARARWRLGTVVQHFLPGTALTWYGDEVGMFGGMDYYADAPMWWRDSALGTTEHFQPEFYALVRWLHQLRKEYPALRRGTFRPVITDDANKIMAFARSLPDEDVVLVVNYGDAKQLVMLPAGKAGDMVGVRSPHFKPPRGTKSAEATGDPMEFPYLSVAGARQFVSKEGKVRMWLDPMSVRVVFLGRYVH